MSHSDTIPDAATLSRAATALAELHANPTLLNLAQATRRLSELTCLGRVPVRVGVVASFTFEPLVPALRLQGLRHGLALDVYCGPFGQIEQELLNPDSGLAAARPDVVLVAARLQDVCPPLHDAFNGLSAEEASAITDAWLARLRAAVEAFRARSQAHLLIQGFEQPGWRALGLADAAASPSQAATIEQANAALRAMAATLPNTRVMDYDALVSFHGRGRWADPKTLFFARIPIAPAHYWPLAGFYIRHIYPLYGLARKVIAVDADNTLWGGVVGDVGLHGITLGHDYPGNAFVAFQRRLLDLHRRGVVLCILSKNQPGTVEEVLAQHPEMVLRPEHFAALRVNWRPKPENLRDLAATLNLGLDSFVFIDDSPVECELMRAALPQVLTVLLPQEPALSPGMIESLDCFEQYTISEEDRARGQLYRAEAGRRELQTAAVDMPSFYRQLEMKVRIFVDHRPHLGRGAQMTQRTNQFNMHTLRCSEDDMRSFMEDPRHRVFTLALADRFGDNGVVGLAVVRLDPREWRLRLFLMSCRVLGRTVEQAFVAWIAGQALAAGAARLTAEFVPTTKNQPFAGFYPDRGLTPAGTEGGVQLYSWDLSQADLTIPDWLDLTVMSSPEAQDPDGQS